MSDALKNLDRSETVFNLTISYMSDGQCFLFIEGRFHCCIHCEDEDAALEIAVRSLREYLEAKAKENE